LKFLDQIFLNLAQYFSMDERTIILSNFRHFSMLLQFILKLELSTPKIIFRCSYSVLKCLIMYIIMTVGCSFKLKNTIIGLETQANTELELPHSSLLLSLAFLFITSTSLTSAVSSNASVPPPKTFLAIFTFSSNDSCRNVN
jgi:hypothetical protein